MTRHQGRIAVLLFLSGLSALIYQTVWLRQLRLIFGASTYATGAVLAIFMAGLGVGSALLGSRADAKERPLAFYARLELLIAAAAAISPLLLLVVARLYFASGGSPALGTAAATMLRLGLTALVIGPATVLMGGTLPAAVRAVETNDDDGRRAVALLYGVNALGAVAGTLLSTFVLLEHAGNLRTSLIAVAVNAAVALAAMRTPATLATPTSGEHEVVLAPERVPPAAVYAASALVGFAFLLMELVWYRMLSPILGGTAYMFGLVLAIALLGIGLGGTAYAMVRSGRATAGGFGVTCSLEALAIAIPFALGDRLAILAGVLRELGTLAGFGGHVLAWAIVTGIVVFPAAFVAGVQFPMLISLLGRGRASVGRHIGVAYAWNTAGAIAGSLAGGFGLLPLLSAPGTWRLVAVLLAAVGTAATYFALRERQRTAPAVAAVSALLAVTSLFANGPTAAWRHSGIGVGRMPRFDSRNELRRWIHGSRLSVAWERDGRESSVALTSKSGYAFIVNGKSDGAARGDASTQINVGILGALLHREARTVLVIGLGTGSSAGWLAAVPSVSRVDVVELEPVVLDVARACAPVNANAMANPKVHVQIVDGREALLAGDSRYDVIASEPSNPYRAGIASLFTREFYRASADRLNPDGVFVQWLQTYGVDEETLRTVYATITDVFPHVQTWVTRSGDLALVASKRPVAIDVAVLRARLAAEPYRSALFNTWRVATVEGLVARLVANEAYARAAASQAKSRNTDDRTVIEFGFARSLDDDSTLTRAIVANAAAMHAGRPSTVRGSLDWKRVDAQRPLNPARPEMVPAIVYGMAEQGAVGTETMVQTLAQRQPIEAKVILAALRAQQHRADEAVALLGDAFVAYRRDPWPDPDVMQNAVALAARLGVTSPERARIVHDAFSQPFVVALQEEARRRTLIETAYRFDGCGARTMAALTSVEPHPLWIEKILAIRMQCYASTHSPRASRAARDYARFHDRG